MEDNDLNTFCNRRRFMTNAAGIAGAASLASAEAAVPALSEGNRADNREWRNRTSDMAYRRLGRTGYMISEFVMGGNHIAPDNYAHVEAAVERGLNYLDSSPDYGSGKCEEGYGRLLRRSSFRQRVYVNCKASIFDNNRNRLYAALYESLSPREQADVMASAKALIARRGVMDTPYLGRVFPNQERDLLAAYLANLLEERYPGRVDRRAEYHDRIIQSVEESLGRLRTDHLDLFMCPHGAVSPEEVRIPEVHEAMDRLKREGKVRAVGFSCHTDSAGVLEAALDTGVYDACMTAYNVVNGAYVETAIRRAYEADVGVISMKAARAVNPNRGPGDYVPPEWLAKLHRAIPGDQWSVPQKAYLWVLANPNLTATVSDLDNLALVEANLSLAEVRVERAPLEDGSGWGS